MSKYRTIPAANVPHYRKTMDTVMRVAEGSAPEMFKWLAWSASIAVLELVRRKTGAQFLSVINVLFFIAVLGRIQFKVLPLRRPETEQPDGSILIGKMSRLGGLAYVAGVLLCWLLAYAVAFHLPRLIADSDAWPTTLDKASPLPATAPKDTVQPVPKPKT